MYVPPTNAPAPAPGVATGIQTNMNDITQSMKDMEKHSLSRKDTEYKKLIINVTNILKEIQVIYKK